jgi:hypothetical protein
MLIVSIINVTVIYGRKYSKKAKCSKPTAIKVQTNATKVLKNVDFICFSNIIVIRDSNISLGELPP